MRLDVRSPRCSRGPGRDRPDRNGTLHRPPTFAGSIASVLEEEGRVVAVVAVLVRTTRRTWHPARETHYISDNSYSDVDDYSLRFLDDYFGGVFGVVSKVEERQVIIRDDEILLERLDDIAPAIADKD